MTALPTGMPPTRRGRETRLRIVQAAADVFRARGFDATTLDDVLAAAGAGKGQFYRSFANKEQLAAAVLDHYADVWFLGPDVSPLGFQTPEDVATYLESIVSGYENSGLVGACPIGMLAVALATADAPARDRAKEVLLMWEQRLEAAFADMRERERLRSDADPHRLAVLTLTTIQGGYVLATALRDASRMRSALRDVVEIVRTSAAGVERVGT